MVSQCTLPLKDSTMMATLGTSLIQSITHKCNDITEATAAKYPRTSSSKGAIFKAKQPHIHPLTLGVGVWDEAQQEGSFLI